MKCLLFFPLAFLLFLSSEVSSENPNMFEFDVLCYDSTARPCHHFAKDLYKQAGQIVSDNLILTKRIKVDIVVEKGDEDGFSAYATPTTQSYNDPAEDGVVVKYPTALIKQINHEFDYDGADMVVVINSSHDDNFWYADLNEQIKDDQYDFFELFLHELFHGLGIATSWNFQKDDSLIPDYEFDTDSDGNFVFEHFIETVFDQYLVSLEHDVQIKTYVAALNDMAGPQGRIYPSEDDFINELLGKEQQEDKTYTKDMLSMATTLDKLGFLPSTAKSINDAIKLDTSSNPLKSGASIIHLASNVYSDTPDFLFLPGQRPGVTLQDNIAANENALGEGVGPNLRLILETIGYQSRIPSTPSTPPTRRTRRTVKKVTL